SPREAAVRIASSERIFLIGQASHERLRLTADNHQQIVEIVRHTPGQLSKGFHLLGLGKLLMRAFECLLGIAPFGYVARDLGESDKFSTFVMYRVDDNIRPEQRTALAHAPGLGFESAGGCSDSQRPVRQTSLAIFRGIKLRKMPADDL